MKLALSVKNAFVFLLFQQVTFYCYIVKLIYIRKMLHKILQCNLQVIGLFFSVTWLKFCHYTLHIKTLCN